jgi:hypothetical protein
MAAIGLKGHMSGLLKTREFVPIPSTRLQLPSLIFVVVNGTVVALTAMRPAVLRDLSLLKEQI